MIFEHSCILSFTKHPPSTNPTESQIYSYCSALAQLMTEYKNLDKMTEYKNLDNCTQYITSEVNNYLGLTRASTSISNSTLC